MRLMATLALVLVLVGMLAAGCGWLGERLRRRQERWRWHRLRHYKVCIRQFNPVNTFLNNHFLTAVVCDIIW
jgi:hypothetical protein